MSIRATIQELAPGALIEVYDLDHPSAILHFVNETNKLDNDITWNGVVYSRYGIEVRGFEYRGNGAIPRPTARISNLGGTLAEFIKPRNDLIGAKVTRHRTFVRYLDAINFPGGVNPTADPLVELPVEIYYVARKVAENPIYIEFELAAGFDVMGVKLPRRQVVQNCCPVKYKSAECGYTGGPVATSSDVPTSDPLLDVCGKRLRSCEMRFGENAELPYGGFPSAGLLR